ncbi:MAG: Tn3 family transposase [Chloroflexales bacterium]|nr:Tn3 family transposase [Chloroflexales bacterium]
MTAIQDTAYPRIRSSLTIHELAEIYTPSIADVAQARRAARGAGPQLGFLVLLKTFQRLGYFLPLTDVPTVIIMHIAAAAHLNATPADLARYDVSGTRRRHLAVIRALLQVQGAGPAARHVMVRAMAEAAQTKDAPADLINVAVEELVRQRFELPAFDTFNRAAHRIRTVVQRGFYRHVAARLHAPTLTAITQMFVVNPDTQRSAWECVKQAAGSATLSHLRQHIEHLLWLETQPGTASLLAGIPDIKVKHFAAEAKTLDAARMRELEPLKQATLAIALVTVQRARVRDDLAEMFMKQMSSIHTAARAALKTYRDEHAQQTDTLITTLRDVVVAYRSDGSAVQRFAAIDGVLGTWSETVLAQCDAHIASTTNSYLPFLWPCYRSHRATLFRLLRTLELDTTTTDDGLKDAIRFLLANETRTGDWLPTAQPRMLQGGKTERTPLVKLHWVPDGWWRLLTDVRPIPTLPARVRRQAFEVCVFSEVMWALKSGDLAVRGSDAFADYREQLIPKAEYDRTVAAYGAMVGFPIDGAAFVDHVKARLAARAQATDATFLSNQAGKLVQGEPVITRPKAKSEPEELHALESRWSDLLTPVNILDLLADTDHWLNWTRCFRPISGHESKLADARNRYLVATLCYGCHIGPSQLARAMDDLNRRQIAWVDLRHVTEEALDQAIRIVINGYNRFLLPKHWGDGRSVSADGTKWDIYEQNLLAEYHIRYGGYGGIGYYHVSDTYIALFSHFIPCGVWEAVYILDGLLKQQSDIQPNIIHADTQGQNEAVFGLAALLGIRLMPRIRQWKHLTFYRPSRDATYTHIDELFTDTIDWNLIATHLSDMLRVVLSIKAGRLTPSTILRKLSTYSQKNKLYQAIRELGRVIRTAFLLEYMSDEALRIMINAATNKSESFNNFAKWLAFGSDGTIRTNDRDVQRKIVKYNHLVANCVIFYNVFAMSNALAEMERKGERVSDEVLGAISPYLTQHVNRLGRYVLNTKRRPATLNYDVFTRSAPEKKKSQESFAGA